MDKSSLFELVESKLNNLKKLIINYSKLDKEEISKNFNDIINQSKAYLFINLMMLNESNISNYVNEILDKFKIDAIYYNEIEQYFKFLLDVRLKFF